MSARDQDDEDRPLGLAAREDDPVPHIDDARLESLLQRALSSTEEGDADLLPADTGPLDAGDDPAGGGWDDDDAADAPDDALTLDTDDDDPYDDADADLDHGGGDDPDHGDSAWGGDL